MPFLKIHICRQITYFKFCSILVSVDSVTNVEVLGRVKNEVYHYVGGQDRCTWSDAQIEGGFNFHKKDNSRHKHF